ncbi:MAG: nucleotidyltransferase family protein [Methylococcaceae bacterium]|jgi:hypothetical protein
MTPILIQVLTQPKQIQHLSLKDWDLLIRQARHANLLARLGYVLENNGLSCDIPIAPLRHIQSAQTYAQQFENTLKWEIKCIAKALNNLNIPIIYLKGTAYFILGSIAAQGRVFSDIDILVNKDQLEQVEAALRRAGWAQHEMDAYDQKYYRQWMHESPPMQHVVRGTSIDVHHNILPTTNEACPDAAKLLAQAEKTPSLDGWVLSTSDRILHSACHLFHEGELDNGLRDLSDLDLLLQEAAKKDPAFWQTILARANDLGLQRSLYYAMHYCGLILKTPIPQGIHKQYLAFAPNRFVLAALDILFLKALIPNHHTCDGYLTKFARWFLFVRSHWLKMPIHLLLPHLIRKGLKNFTTES